MEILHSLREQPSRQQPGFYTCIYDKMAQINVIMTFNKRCSREERDNFISNAENYAHEAMKSAQSSQDTAAIAKTRLSELFVRAKRVELDCASSTTVNEQMIQKSTQIIKDITRALNDLSTSGLTNLDEFTSEAQSRTEHLRRILVSHGGKESLKYTYKLG